MLHRRMNQYFRAVILMIPIESPHGIAPYKALLCLSCSMNLIQSANAD